MLPQATKQCYRMNVVTADLSSYELVWPTALFVAEGGRIVRTGGTLWGERATWLLTEALSGTMAVADFEDAANLNDRQATDPWASTSPSPRSSDGDGQREWFAELINRGRQRLSGRGMTRAMAAPSRGCGSCGVRSLSAGEFEGDGEVTTVLGERVNAGGERAEFDQTIGVVEVPVEDRQVAPGGVMPRHAR
jgi:hypothetical protein